MQSSQKRSHHSAAFVIRYNIHDSTMSRLWIWPDESDSTMRSLSRGHAYKKSFFGFVSSTRSRFPFLSRHLFLFHGWPWVTLCDLVRPIIRRRASGCNRGNGLTPCFNSEKACTCLLASCPTLTSVSITTRERGGEGGGEGAREMRERGQEGFSGSEDARV